MSAVMAMYDDARTVLITVCGNSEVLEVGVGMHRGSPLTVVMSGDEND